jgi:type III secretory pathway component EscU
LRNPELEMRRRKLRADIQSQKMGQAAQAAKFMV